jgi:aromatic ring-opening dioxygenase LigB subunit
MSLVGCFAVPHPPIIIPEVGGSSLAEADATVRAMSVLRERAAVIDPDTIVLLSPHSPLARSQMGISLAAEYKGSLAYFRTSGWTSRGMWRWPRSSCGRPPLTVSR